MYSSSISCWLVVLAVIVEVVTAHLMPDSVEVSHDQNDNTEADDFLSTFGYYPPEREVSDQGLTAKRSMDQKSSDKDGEGRMSQLGGHFETDIHSEKERHLDTAESHSETERQEALVMFQSFFHLRETGQMDSQTKQLMELPRCGNVDTSQPGSASPPVSTRTPEVKVKNALTVIKKRIKRYKVSRFNDGSVNFWKVNKLSWKITHSSGQLNLHKQREIVRESLNKWAQVVPITFVEETRDTKPDIEIRFVRGKHGIGNDQAFDGKVLNDKANKLAHAFGPGDPTSLAGDVHFDEDDDWSDAERLMGVAVHELGHVMGLGHSTDVKAIMYPFFRDQVSLGEDDILGIRFLYASHERPLPTIDPVTRCLRQKVDAVFEDPSTKFTHNYFVMSGNHIQRFNTRGGILQTSTLQELFPYAPSGADVVFSIPWKNSVYFVKNHAMWCYKDHTLVPGFPRALRKDNFIQRPKFVINTDDEKSSEVMMFSDHYWWTYDVDRPTRSHYRPISEFNKELPSDVRFAARWIDGLVYAVTDDSYVVLEAVKRTRSRTKPIAGRPEWLKRLCGAGNIVSSSSLLLAIALTVIALLSRS